MPYKQSLKMKQLKSGHKKYDNKKIKNTKSNRNVPKLEELLINMYIHRYGTVCSLDITCGHYEICK